MALTTQQGKALLHELTIEYIKQNDLLHCRFDDIDEKVAFIAQISAKFEKAIEKNYHDIKFL